MMVKLIFTEPIPMEDLDLPEELEIICESVAYEDGDFFDAKTSELIAQVFEETMVDKINNIAGHPAAGKIFIPRTFDAAESDHPDYPGKPYGRVRFEAVY